MENKFSQVNMGGGISNWDRESSSSLENINAAIAYRHMQIRWHSTYGSTDLKAGFTSKLKLC